MQYIIYLLLGILCFYLSKDSFNLGLFKITDETMLEVAMAVKAFGICYLLMTNYSTDTLLDFDLAKRHRELQQRWNLATAPFGTKFIECPIEVSYFVFGLTAAIISFVTVRTSVRFAFFFYNVTESSADEAGDDVQSRT